MTKKEELLEELANCWRGDWSEFDGRTLQSQIATWIGLVDTDDAIKAYRDECDMCPLGQGHWIEYCVDYHPEQAPEQADGEDGGE